MDVPHKAKTSVPITLHLLCQRCCSEPLWSLAPPPTPPHPLPQHHPRPLDKVNKSARWEACAPGKLARMWLSAEQMSSPTESTPDPAHTEPNTFLCTTRRTTTTKGLASLYSHSRRGLVFCFFLSFFFCRQWMKILWPWCLMWVPLWSSAGFHVGNVRSERLAVQKQEQGHRQRG